MSWNVLHIKANREQKLVDLCCSYAIESYLPMRAEVKVYQRRKVTVRKPLFRGYLFADINPGSRSLLMQTNYVLAVLNPVCESDLLLELEQVRMALKADPSLRSETGFRRGDRVRIKGGAFAGIEGILETVRGRSKVRLNVELVGQSVALDVDQNMLEVL